MTLLYSMMKTVIITFDKLSFMCHQALLDLNSIIKSPLMIDLPFLLCACYYFLHSQYFIPVPYLRLPAVSWDINMDGQ